MSITRALMAFFRNVLVMSTIERKYCLIGTSYLAGLFDFFILLHI